MLLTFGGVSCGVKSAGFCAELRESSYCEDIVDEIPDTKSSEDISVAKRSILVSGAEEPVAARWYTLG